MRLFRIDYPNEKSFVVLTKSSWIDLVGIFNDFCDKSKIYIKPLSFWESIKYILEK